MNSPAPGHPPVGHPTPETVDPQIPEQFQKVAANIRKIIMGKDEVIARLLWAVAAQGHVLFRDVPGVGKTMLAKAFAASVDCTFKRIQFTPDLLPMDVSGSNVFDMRSKTFQFQPGPVFTNVLLADEINRAPPKTQSALLEVMEERQVTVEGTTHKLEPPFIAIATMNPLDDEGTYPLPAAQLDRFMMMLSVGYPPEDAEAKMLEVHLGTDVGDVDARARDHEGRRARVAAGGAEDLRVARDASLSRRRAALDPHRRPQLAERFAALDAAPRARVPGACAVLGTQFHLRRRREDARARRARPPRDDERLGRRA